MNQDNENNEEIDYGTDVEFFEEKYQTNVSYDSDTPLVIEWVMKYGGIKEQRQAEYILLGFVVLVVVISLFLFFSGGVDIPPEALKYPEYGLPAVD